jgi:replication factor C subunit 3/5
MFLVDKYYNDSNYIKYHQTIIDKILNNFDIHNEIYSNIDSIIKLPNNEFCKIINNLENGTWRYSNFQHLIIYGPNGCGKEYLVNKLLEKIYGKSSVELREVEYTVSGYSSTKTKIMIKQSKYHIIIEPNSNGFDKYLIQEIIQDYAKSELLNILKHRKLFKIVVINKIDNLSYYAQASLRRTMEKYSDTCKFILISDQLSRITEPIRSRCLMIRIGLPTYAQILETLLYICEKENLKVDCLSLYEIIKQSDNKINNAIWLLEMYKYGINYNKNWERVINNIVDMILDPKIKNNKKLYSTMKKIREQFYSLFITNIPTQLIIRKIIVKLLERIDDLKLKYNVIDITSIFEQRLSQGTRHIIHIEAYITKLIYLFTTYKEQLIKSKNLKIDHNNYNLDVLEI